MPSPLDPDWDAVDQKKKHIISVGWDNGQATQWTVRPQSEQSRTSIPSSRSRSPFTPEEFEAEHLRLDGDGWDPSRPAA